MCDSRDELAAAFDRVTDWTADYMRHVHSQSLGEAFEHLLRHLQQVATLPVQSTHDEFERLKELDQDSRLRLFELASALQTGPAWPASSSGPPGTRATTNLFIYGTLKRGFPRHYALLNQRFLGEATTAPGYRLFDCGHYPGLVESTDGRVIEGELWEVDSLCLAELDDIEGVALNLYQRGPVKLAPPFDELSVETYYFARNITGLRDCGTRWGID